MLKQVLISLALLVLLCSAGAPNRILFGPHTVTYTITNGVMQVQIQAKNNGWVAFGKLIRFIFNSEDQFSRQMTIQAKIKQINGLKYKGFGDSMVNSDIVTVRNDGTLHVEDRYSTTRGVAPPLDTSQSGQQNWSFVTGGFNNGVWDITISRALSTGDSKDMTIINGKRFDTLFAIGSEMSFTQKHKFFWEYEDIKYSDEQLDDQDGAAGKLTVTFSLIIGFIIYLVM